MLVRTPMWMNKNRKRAKTETWNNPMLISWKMGRNKQGKINSPQWTVYGNLLYLFSIERQEHDQISAVHSRPIIFIHSLFLFSPFIKRFYLFIFKKGERRENERERNISVWLPLMCPQLGTWPVTQACALTGNWTGDTLVRRLTLSPLSHASQGTFTVPWSLKTLLLSLP